nr:MAG: replication initiator protein [Microviridae sp.]
MACFSPLSAWQLSNGSVVFAERGDIVRSLTLPCGQCIGCRLERSRQWAVRCLHESSLHDNNCFITLTYNDDCCPLDYSLNYRDFQLFMKRLRKAYTGIPIRFYMCGEYGENFGRPHFHAVIFGISFTDLDLVGKSPAGSSIYRSALLESLWTKGFSSVGAVTFESCAYVARYIMKKVTGVNADNHYEHVDTSTGEVIWRVPEFTRMSLKPGIGAQWFEKFVGDVFPHDRVVVNGKACKPPKYYDRLYSKYFPIDFENIQYEREIKAKLFLADTTPERLKVRAQVTEARLARFSRTIK